MLSMVAVSVRRDRQEYYLRLSEEDYYVRSGEPLGEWVGRGAAELGLQGQVDGYEFLSLLDGKGRDGEEPLVEVRRGATHDPGWDMTFSAPKGVSVLWAAADAPTRETIEDCLKAAVVDTVTHIEDSYKLARRGPQGRRREHVKLIASSFLHGTSRELDPNLHVHLLLMNAAVRADGTTGAILSKPLYNDKLHLGHVFRYAFAARLQHELGLEVYWYGKDLFDVVGVPEPVKVAMSQRRQQIEARLAKQGLSSAEDAAKAALATRRPKEMQERGILFAQWEQDLRALGFDREQAMGLLHRVRRDPAAETREPEPRGAAEVAERPTARPAAEQATERADATLTTDEHTRQATDAAGLAAEPLDRMPEEQTAGPVGFEPAGAPHGLEGDRLDRESAPVRDRWDTAEPGAGVADPRAVAPHSGVEQGGHPEREVEPRHQGGSPVRGQELARDIPDPEPQAEHQAHPAQGADGQPRTTGPARGAVAHEAGSEWQDPRSPDEAQRQSTEFRPGSTGPDWEQGRDAHRSAGAEWTSGAESAHAGPRPSPEETIRERLGQLADQQGGFHHQQAFEEAMRATRERPLRFERLADAVFSAAEHLRLWVEEWRSRWVYAQADLLRGVRDTMVEQADELHRRPFDGVPEWHLRPRLLRPPGAGDRQEAFDHLVGRGHRIRVLDGPLNADTYELLADVCDAWTIAGKDVKVVIPNAEALNDFRSHTGLEAYASRRWASDLSEGWAHDLLHHAHMIGRAYAELPYWHPSDGRLTIGSNSVVLLVDAGGVPLAEMAVLIDQVHRHNAVILAHGDEALRPYEQAVQPGRPDLARVPNPFLDLCEAVARRGRLSPQEVLPSWRAEAQEDLRRDQVAGALHRFAENDRLTVTAEQPEAWQALLRDWRQKGARNPAEHLILASDEAAAHGLNRRAQLWRQSLHELGDLWVLSGTDRIFAHDRVQFVYHRQGRRAAPGQLGTVIAVEPLTSTVVVRLDVPRPDLNSIDETKIVAVPARHLQLGYAVTALPGHVYRQEHCYGLVEGRRAEVYRQMSQAQGDLHLYLGLDRAPERVRDELARYRVEAERQQEPERERPEAESQTFRRRQEW